MAEGLTFEFPVEAIKKAVADFDAILQSKTGVLEPIIARYGTLVWTAARENLTLDPHRVDEGTLRGSVHIRGEGLQRDVFTAIEYAIFVHWGTGIYGTNPKGGHRKTPWVYFDQKRKKYFFTRGMKPNPFMQDAVRDHEDAFIRDVIEALKR
jgi:hypothetical protein